MSIDKEKLKGLLWAEAASYRAGCAGWKRNTEALDEFLGEKTLGEAALELLAENEVLRSDIQSWRLSIEAERNVHKLSLKGVQDELDRLTGPSFTEEMAALRKGAVRYEWLRDKQTFIWLIQDWFPSDAEFTDVDAVIDVAMANGERS